MSSWAIRLVMAVLMGSVGLTAVSAEERPAVGAITGLQPEAKALYGDSERRLSLQSVVRFRDILTTGDRARLKARLNDGSEVTLGASAELLVDEFIYQPQEKQHRLGLRSLRGAFLFVGGRENKAIRQTEIEMPVAVLGVRGTTVWGGDIDEGCGIFVLAGEVTVTNATGSVTLTAGEGTTVFPDGSAPTEPVIWPEEKIQRAMEMVEMALR